MMKKINAIGFVGGCDLSAENAFVDIELDWPNAQGHDLLIEIKAIAVNPLDTKVRSKQTEKLAEPKVLGWDVAGTVIEVGEQVTLFNVGDEVFYSGNLVRQGSNASHQLIDERLVGHKPKSLSFEQAAALPLTSITAWECLFDRLKIDPVKDSEKNILIIGGAGGVGSIAIQIAKKVANLNIIATASREETVQWCHELGANHCINHHQDMPTQLQQLGLKEVDYILCLNSTEKHFNAMATMIKPQSLICCIVDMAESVDINLLKPKSAGLVWEMMMTRPMFATDDQNKQGELLNKVSQLVDENVISTTLKNVLGNMNVENIVKAHQLLEQGNTIGKIVLTR